MSNKYVKNNLPELKINFTQNNYNMVFLQVVIKSYYHKYELVKSLENGFNVAYRY